VLHVACLGDANGNLHTSSHGAARRVEFSRHIQLAQTPADVPAILQILAATKEALPWAAIAAVIMAWLKVRSGRRVTIRSTESGHTMEFAGYSEAEVARML
jgi:hypothetical protein